MRLRLLPVLLLALAAGPAACAAPDADAVAGDESALTGAVTVEDHARFAPAYPSEGPDAVEVSPDGRYAIYRTFDPATFASKTRFRDLASGDVVDVPGLLEKRTPYGYLHTETEATPWGTRLVHFDGTIGPFLANASSETTTVVASGTKLVSGRPPSWSSSMWNVSFSFTDAANGTFSSAPFTPGATVGYARGVFVEDGARFLWSATTSQFFGASTIYTAAPAPNAPVTATKVKLDGKDVADVHVLEDTVRAGTALTMRGGASLGFVDLATGSAKQLSQGILGWMGCGRSHVEREDDVYWFEETPPSPDKTQPTTFALKAWSRKTPDATPRTLRTYTETLVGTSGGPCNTKSLMTLTEDGAWVVYLAPAAQRFAYTVRATRTDGTGPEFQLDAANLADDTYGQLFALGKGSVIAYRTGTGFAVTDLAKNKTFTAAIPQNAWPLAMNVSKGADPLLAFAYQTWEQSKSGGPMDSYTLDIVLADASGHVTKHLGTSTAETSYGRFLPVYDGSFLFTTNLTMRGADADKGPALYRLGR